MAVSIEVNLDDIVCRKGMLMKLLGSHILFSNGCSLSLINEGGVYWGSTPYGLDWACNADENWVDAVMSWLNFWDHPRRENGQLLDEATHFCTQQAER